MALDKATLKAGIKTLTENLWNQSATQTPAQAREAFADGLANLIDAFVKSGDGVYQPGTLKAGTTVVTALPSTIVKMQ
jgi:hypothetical protein